MHQAAIQWIRETSEPARAALLQQRIDEGAVIPFLSDVAIAPTVTLGKDCVILAGCVLTGDTVIGDGCVIGPGTILHNVAVGENSELCQVHGADATVGSGCSIGPFVHIRPNTVLGDNVHLGNFVEVKNSTVGDGTKVSHLTYVGDSDVGKDVNFGCGTVTVNYTGKEKFRTTIGDHCFIGCNTNLIAPVTVGDYGYTAAGSTITDDVPANALAIARARQVNKDEWVLRKKPYKE